MVHKVYLYSIIMDTSSINSDLGRYNSVSRGKDILVNVGWPERIASIGAGARLLAGGLKNILNHPVRNTIMTATGGYLIYRGVTGNCPLYTFMNQNARHYKSSNINIRTSVYVDEPRQEVYNFWRNLENLPLFMSHLKSVKTTGEKRSSWEAKLPGNIATISWDAEIVNDEPGKVIGWKSVGGSGIDNAGKVEFMDTADGQGTVIQVVISYLPPPGGFIKSKMAGWLSPAFEKVLRNDINSFKNHIEHSEITKKQSFTAGSDIGGNFDL